MDSKHKKLTTYLYTYNCYEEERSLCALEMRTFFGSDSPDGIVESHVKIDPSRSPFMKERIAVIYEGESLQELLKQVAALQVTDETFKVIYVKMSGPSKTEQEGFENRRAILL